LKKSGHTDGSSLSKEEFEKVRGFCLTKSFEMVVRLTVLYMYTKNALLRSAHTVEDSSE
jgi:hypothetical protein